ncbi:type II toxin-antitoxin system RnlB family antitoxin [Flavobacterium psychrophilum]|uniref:type II toxin-antitoxin system RnlB family antitoxin n=1 Tax=Flavobacterium psychrophilum TaxID=96345 RepID=UPI001D091CF4|nr:type II toxin-antitoxin system RnlB family antitoxin [Flavobacterium psychrophilum]MCB6000527.1 type II toxin-antitoxin system RnlB family antitoxin [Flavobacterium psychrophilum]MCB6015409.1 type II toxin-antitoxin system RnlB family antitoxin [Flavobacterium psychrophilum]MCB6022873.1 type II toxin-antitoxin system RnlB family antitoxin [Flavobacterium psychrophilum]MCB6032818.1 type II toxin-antitoxin system RnlB family antitoxin [Flavobacterium psychrophilum]MCB6037847.1 type II toxin-a
MDRSTYILKNVNVNQYKIILISKDMSRLQEYISSVENDLQINKTKSYVLFDLLLNNNIDDRFYKCFFDGNKFVRDTLTKVQNSEIDNEINFLTSSYYLKNDYLFEDLFFTKEYKNQILNKLQKIVKNTAGNSGACCTTPPNILKLV